MMDAECVAEGQCGLARGNLWTINAEISAGACEVGPTLRVVLDVPGLCCSGARADERARQAVLGVLFWYRASFAPR